MRADLSEALAIVGGLSRTTKMPCHSWGIPARACKTGARLAKEEQSVCGVCYARRGKYSLPCVATAQERRLRATEHPDWVAAMTLLVEWQAGSNKQPFFRWFDAGDLQSTSMLERIISIANNTPGIEHWLPTREHEIVRTVLRDAEPPGNLTIRLSAHYIDRPPPRAGLPTSTVHSRAAPHGVACTAYNRQPARCGPCRACWDQSIPNISYPRH